MERFTGSFMQQKSPSIEDCAHTMDRAWKGLKSGRYPAGLAAEYFADVALAMPNGSGRMDNLRAAILHTQLQAMDAKCRRWNEKYAAVERMLRQTPGIDFPSRSAKEQYLASSIEFRLPGFTDSAIRRLVDACLNHGVELKWFDASMPVTFTINHQSWRYVSEKVLLQMDRIPLTLFDMRLPLTFSLEDCELIGYIIREWVLTQSQSGSPVSAVTVPSAVSREVS
jgi:hypothetical protein